MGHPCVFDILQKEKIFLKAGGKSVSENCSLFPIAIVYHMINLIIPILASFIRIISL